ncbi:MAG TPA: alpha/beta hydrolase [Bryobacteraceae bacterium]|nr:alpha/beta hydrolase [Bryobacteraceae bacterium]
MTTRTMILVGCTAAVLLGQRATPEPAAFPLWSGGAPGAQGKEDKDTPALTPWIAKNPNGKAIVVCPGGGYGALAVDHEGRQIAQWLNSQGISAFVLRYRLGPKYRHPAMIHDVQRAIRTVRARAAEFGVNPAKLGVMGFSAGGHLSATAATHFDAGQGASEDPIERVSSRPDFAVLAYPVITFTEEAYVHKGSRRNLLGENPDPKLVENLSNEKAVTRETPPTFLFHTDADSGVPPENSVLFYLALRKHGIPAELHIYEKGPHGVGLAWSDLVLSSWPARLADWLRNR